MTQVGAPDGRRSSTPAAPVMIDIEALPDPYVLYESVRDESGRIVDFRFAAVNAAAVADFGLAREQLLSSTLLNLHPLTGDGILFDDFVHAVDSGEPLILEDFENPSTPPKGDRRFYDISANRVGDGLGVSWWDVTQRYRSDRAVAKAEMRWRSTLESLLDPLQVLSPVRDETGDVVDFEYVQVNQAACDFLRKSRDEVIGSRVRSVWPGEAAELVFGWARHILLTGQPLSVDEQEVMLPGGVVRLFDVRGVRADQLVSFTHRDVTDRAAQAREIAESREHFRLLAENASEMVFQTGADHLLSWVSPSVTRVLGWQPEQLLGHGLPEFIHPDDLADVMGTQQELINSGELSGRVEYRLATVDGRWRWMSVLGQALLDDDGNLIGGVDAVRDIQAEKDAAQALAESEERFRRSMMDAAIGMAMVSPLGQFMRVNPALCRLLSRDEATLMSSTWQDITHPDDLDADLDLVGEVLSGQRDTYRMQKRYLRPDGEVVWTDLTVSSVRDDEGHVRYFMSQVIDITDSVHAREALARSEEHYRLLAENSSDVVFRASADGYLEWISPSVQDVLGWDPEKVMGRSILEFVSPEDVPQDLRLGVYNRDDVDFQGRVRAADGSARWMDIESRPLIDSDGELLGRAGRLRDIQEQHEAQDALRRSEQRFRTAMESAPTGMAVIGLNREFVEVNPALCALLGRSEDWLLGHGMHDVLDPVDDDLDRRLRAQILAGLTPSLTRDHQMIRSDGERVLVEQSIGLLHDERGQASAYVSQFADVTEAREAREQLRFLATHDSLTELLNRRELVTRIAGVLGQTPRTGVNVGVLFIDLDNLKAINDSNGHAVGDQVIVTVARRIRGQIRTNDVLARFGGDEFVLVLPAIHSVDDAERIAQNLHSAVEVPITAEDRQIAVTLSIGVAVVRPGENPDVAMRQADAALYRAKREGRARTVVYDPRIDGA